jgi:hypothetical protein
MLTDNDRADVAKTAQRLGLDPAVLTAVVMVESGGRVFARINGRDEPLIRWEGHYFDRLVAPALQEAARARRLSSPTAGAIANPASQAARWALLDRAAALDKAAAYASASWGVGQVMGAHWRRLGYDSIDAFVSEARRGFDGQLALMVRYIEWAGLVDALRRHDWHASAAGYNGPAYRRNGYHLKIAAAYRSAAASSSGGVAILRAGDRGAAVAALQTDLADRGATLAIDGVFGPRTQAAVRAFQRQHGLVVDGIVGPATRAALGQATSTGARCNSSAPAFARLTEFFQGLHRWLTRRTGAD